MASTTQNRLPLGAAALVLGAFAPNIVLAQNAQTEVVLEATFRTPAPPNDAFVQNVSHVVISTSVMLSLALICTVISFFESKRYNTTIPKAIVLGAAFCVVPEAIDNYLGGCYWSQSHDPKQLLFFLMGREYDYYVAIMWWAFGAILGYIIYAALLREVKTGTLWICMGLSGLADIIIEETLLNYGGIYMYFGHQPLVLISMFPWWWLFCNVSSIFLSIAICYRYREWFNGWRSLFILALMPFCYIGGFTLSGMPTIFAIQGDFSPAVTQLAGIFSCVVAIVQTGAMMDLILDRDPLAFGEGPRATKLGNGKVTNGYVANGKAANGKVRNGAF